MPEKTNNADLFATPSKKRLFQEGLTVFLEAFLLRKAAQTPMITGKHTETFALEKDTASCLDTEQLSDA